MLKIHRILHNSEREYVINLLELHARNKLTLDVSSYAKGRNRTWLRAEPQLTSNSQVPIFVKSILPIPDLEIHVWNMFKSVGFNPDCALCIQGPVGIKPHRDGSYAATKAVGINLGEVKWMYGKTYSDIEYVKIPLGAIYSFNCKMVHAAEPVDPLRWAINGWNFSKSRKYITE